MRNLINDASVTALEHFIYEQQLFIMNASEQYDVGRSGDKQHKNY